MSKGLRYHKTKHLTWAVRLKLSRVAARLHVALACVRARAPHHTRAKIQHAALPRGLMRARSICSWRALSGSSTKSLFTRCHSATPMYGSPQPPGRSPSRAKHNRALVVLSH